MFNFADVALEQLSIHQVGNPVQDGELKISEAPLPLEDDVVRDLLLQYFLSAFKTDALHHFYADEETGLDEHALYGHIARAFAEPKAFHEVSEAIAEHLYRQTTHPNIRNGELYVAYFSHCVADQEIVDAIGIFKSENKDTFLKVYPKSDGVALGYDSGIDIKRLDKGCLILNSEAHLGYKIAIVDKINRNEEALYWREHFLKLRPREDSYFHTKNYLQLCRDFVNDVFNPEHNVDRSEQIEMLNRTSKFFQTRETFTTPEFEDEVIQEPTVADAFKEYKETYAQERHMPHFVEEFDISTPAVKSNKKILKSILKLDKNFSVYVHGNRDFLEKGFDEERELQYYKLYFREEK
jgi:hypothetical protein